MKLQRILLMAIMAVVLLVLTWQMPTWLTGRVNSDPLTLIAGVADIPPRGRIWIDTDAACGAPGRADPDDCFAILWLVAQGFDIVGVSTSFGNAPGDVVADRTAALVGRMAQDGLPVPPVFRGYAEPLVQGSPVPPAVGAFHAALREGPLTVLALGPMTNIAAALEGEPDLRANVIRLVAVMAHQPGHLFHPSEGKATGALFGHGPIFSDLNVSADPDAVSTVLAMNLPMTLIPYDAARGIQITAPDLDLLASHSPTFAWLAQTSRDWLAFWNDDIGLPGFYPFDWVAAAYLADPRLFDCATVSARMAREWTFWVMPRASLLVENSASENVAAKASIQYCPVASPRLHDVLIPPNP